jgi:hypothetical protein
MSRSQGVLLEIGLASLTMIFQDSLKIGFFPKVRDHDLFQLQFTPQPQTTKHPKIPHTEAVTKVADQLKPQPP